MRRRLAAVLFVLAVVAAACGGSNHLNSLERATGPTSTESTVPETTTTTVAVTVPPSTTGAPSTPRSTTRRPAVTTPRGSGGAAPSPAPSPANLAAVRARLTPIAGVSQALAMAVRVNDAGLYVASKSGQVTAIRGGQVDPVPVLDLGGQVSTGGEQGLLGLAFSPDGTHLYVNYTDVAGDTHVVEYAMNGGVANAGARRELLFVKQPYANHNGGNLVFGPDGFLWIGLGDGGSEGDPNNNAQNPGTPLGLRNPWRYSFDRATGSLWIGDVGQSAWEEIDFASSVQSAGMNFGWSRFEGNHIQNAAVSAPGAVPPVYEYPHGGGVCAVTAGYVYRGARIANMNGVYLFADFCVGHVMGLANGQVRDLGMTASNLASFGEDLNGELYVLSLSGGVSRIDPA